MCNLVPELDALTCFFFSLRRVATPSIPLSADCKDVPNGTAERSWCGTCSAEDDGDTCGKIVGGTIGAFVILAAVIGGVLLINIRRPIQDSFAYTAVGSGLGDGAMSPDHEMGFSVPNTTGRSLRDAMLSSSG